MSAWKRQLKIELDEHLNSLSYWDHKVKQAKRDLEYAQHQRKITEDDILYYHDQLKKLEDR